MKKKGFTLLELLICITLISVVVIFLFRLINTVRKDEQVVGYIKENQVNRNELMRYIGKIFSENTICGYTIQEATSERANIRFNFCNANTSGMTDQANIYVEKKNFYVSYNGETRNFPMKDSSAYYDPEFITSSGTFNRNTYTKITFKAQKKGLENNSIDDIELYWIQPQYVPSTVTRTFDYTGGEQTFTAPETGVYLLEVWGAQGGFVNNSYKGGYGGYSRAKILLTKSDVLFINVGGKPVCSENNKALIEAPGGYNGGGNACNQEASGTLFNCPGGGATSIALKSGLLQELSSTNDKRTILIVAGGGGGATYMNFSSTDYVRVPGGSGGGYIGQNSVYVADNVTSNHSIITARGGSQSSGGEAGYIDNGASTVRGSFGRAYVLICSSNSNKYAGGGGGYYGGGSSISAGGGGGSGYIGSSLLSDAAMYCIGCSASSNAFTKTTVLSSSDVSSSPLENKAKEGHGYARITLLDDTI